MIKFLIFDWKEDVNVVLGDVLPLANKKKINFVEIDTGGDEFCVAYSEEEFTKEEAVTKWENGVEDDITNMV